MNQSNGELTIKKIVPLEPDDRVIVAVIDMDAPPTPADIEYYRQQFDAMRQESEAMDADLIARIERILNG